jgi:hypothetical protein
MRILSKYNQKGDVNFGDTRDCEFVNNIVVVNDTITSKAFGYHSVAENMPISGSTLDCRPRVRLPMQAPISVLLRWTLCPESYR